MECEAAMLASGTQRCWLVKEDAAILDQGKGGEKKFVNDKMCVQIY